MQAATALALALKKKKGSNDARPTRKSVGHAPRRTRGRKTSSRERTRTGSRFTAGVKAQFVAFVDVADLIEAPRRSSRRV